MALTTVQAAMGGTGVTSFPAPSTSGNVLTSDGTNWTSAAAGGFTVGQTLTNVTGSRTLGTTYTNSTGKAIAVTMYTNGDAYTGARIFINGNITMRDESGYHPGYSAFSGVFGIVPNGATYKIEGGPSVAAWWELR